MGLNKHHSGNPARTGTRKRTRSSVARLGSDRPSEGFVRVGTTAWQTIMEKIEDALVMVNGEGRVLLANAAARRIFGESVYDTVLRDWNDTFDMRESDGITRLESDRQPLARALRGESIEGAEILVCRSMSSTDNVWLRVDAMPCATGEKNRRGAFAVFHDLTQQKQAENELLLQKHAIESSTAGITISDATQPDNPLVYVNDGFLRLTGYAREEVIGQNCRFLQQGEADPKAREAIRTAMEQESPCTVELLNFRKDGAPFWNRLTITPVRDDAGRVRNFIGIQSDITDRVLAEQGLQQTTRELREANRHLVENLDAAARVQQALLPPSDLQVPGAEFAWRFRPCEELAGDILNVMRLDESHVGMYVLDVTGHGTAAALLSVTVSRFLSPANSAVNIVKKHTDGNGAYAVTSPAEVANELNEAFPWEPQVGQFFTLAYGVLNTKTRKFRFVTAGHPGILRISADGTTQVLRTGGLPIGIRNDTYEENCVSLAPGDRVFMLSDGVTETMNGGGEQIGQDRLAEILYCSGGNPLTQVLDRVMGELDAWKGDAPLRDDISLLAFSIPQK